MTNHLNYTFSPLKFLQLPFTNYPLSLIHSLLINMNRFQFQNHSTKITVYLKLNRTFHISLTIFEYNESLNHSNLNLKPHIPFRVLITKVIVFNSIKLRSLEDWLWLMHVITYFCVCYIMCFRFVFRRLITRFVFRFHIQNMVILSPRCKLENCIKTGSILGQSIISAIDHHRR